MTQRNKEKKLFFLHCSYLKEINDPKEQGKENKLWILFFQNIINKKQKKQNKYIRSKETSKHSIKLWFFRAIFILCIYLSTSDRKYVCMDMFIKMAPSEHKQ